MVRVITNTTLFKHSARPEGKCCVSNEYANIVVRVEDIVHDPKVADFFCKLRWPRVHAFLIALKGIYLACDILDYSILAFVCLTRMFFPVDCY